MKTIYVITVETRHGVDSILVTTEPTHKDLGLIENYYLTAYDLRNVHVDYYQGVHLNKIPTTVNQWIKQEQLPLNRIQ